MTGNEMKMLIAKSVEVSAHSGITEDELRAWSKSGVKVLNDEWLENHRLTNKQ